MKGSVMSFVTHPLIGGLRLPLPIMIGAGVCKAPASTLPWLSVAPVVSGSYTPLAREGNLGSVFYPSELATFFREGRAYNWLGMPNLGATAMLQQFAGIAKEHSLIISIAAFAVEDYIELIHMVADAGVADAIELNFGCQNTEHGKPLSFDVHGLKRMLQLLPEVNLPIWLKFSPYDTTTSFMRPAVIKLVNQYQQKIKAVVTCNTQWIFAGNDKISSPDGYASLSGPELSPIALQELDCFRAGLHSEIDVISVGAIVGGNDIVNRFARGASAVQLTSLPYLLGTPNTFFEHILEDGLLEPYLRNEGYL